MPVRPEEIDQMAKEFEDCKGILLALGDENRQRLILEMMRMIAHTRAIMASMPDRSGSNMTGGR